MKTILTRICAALLVGAPVAAGVGCDSTFDDDGTTASGAGGAGQGGAGQGGQGGAGQGGQGGSGAGDPCSDGAQNGAETDVDCGGGTCAPCASGLSCQDDPDCASGLCTGGACAYVLLVSEVRTRGNAGGTDEFIEIYNPTAIPVTVDSSWRIEVKDATQGDCASNAYDLLWSGAGEVIPPHGHLLITGGGYNQLPAADAEYSGVLLPDAGSARLMHDVDVADSLCFYYDNPTLLCMTTHTCEGDPVQNPHNGNSSTNDNTSLERKPGGDMGNTADTGNNGLDFAVADPARPENLASPPAPAAP